MYLFPWRNELILRLRWILMLLLGGLAVFYELNEHGLEALRELQFNLMSEVLVMGFILPLLGGSLLTELAHPEEGANRARPKDQSLEAYKAWITEITKRLTTQTTTIELTEAEWIEDWKEYWEQKLGS